MVRVTDKFLQRIDDADLRTSGRALFYASVLIRMKSDVMLGEGDDEEDPVEPWEQAMHEDAPIEDPDPFAALESEMDRRLERRRARGMPQTLDELVRDLRDAERESWWKESREYDTSDSPSGYDRGTQELDYRGADDMRLDEEPSAADVTGTAHAENIDDIIADVHDAVREQYDQAARRCCTARSTPPAGPASRRSSDCSFLPIAARSASSRTTFSATSGFRTQRRDRVGRGRRGLTPSESSMDGVPLF